MRWTGTHRRQEIGQTGKSTRLTILSTTTVAVALLAMAGYGMASADSEAQPAPCVDTNVPPNVEEERLDLPAPGSDTPVGTDSIRRGGFTGLVDEFASALCDVPDAATATATVDRLGRSLWQAAVSRAQGADPSTPADALPATDDRPLYWARLAMARALRQWTPGFSATEQDRSGWQKTLEYASRGITTSDFTSGQGARKLFISGFDPFLLDDDIRRSNPSGSAVLRLDGRVLNAGGASVQVQVVMLPVRYQDFEDGIVEDAFRPHLAAGGQGADMFTTISQGEFGRFDLEVFNGRRRAVSTIGDNLRVTSGGSDSAPVVMPGVGPGPEFTRSTLPVERMQARGEDGAFPVVIDPHVREIPAGSRTPRDRANGPTQGSTAVEGGGGSYLSNESAYRVTLLASGAGRTLPAGHLHTPVLEFDPTNESELSDPTLVANRTAIVTEVEQLLLAGVAALP